MTYVPRATVMNAFVNLFQVGGGPIAPFVSVSRRLEHWDDVTPSDQPALYVIKHSEDVVRRKENLPSVTTFKITLMIYIRTGDDQTSVPAETVDTILDAIDTALTPDIMTNRLTLGGLVSHAFISGEIRIEPGDIDGQGIIIVPVDIMVP
jgi:hypothetical protein